MTRQPDLLAGLRDLAPDGMPWFCTDRDGDSWFQNKRGKGKWWVQGDGSTRFVLFNEELGSELSLTAIHLPTGVAHIQKKNGAIIEVPRSEWEVMP